MSITQQHPPHNELLSGPMVWRRDDLMNQTDWQLQISQRQLDELDRVIRQHGNAVNVESVETSNSNPLTARADLLPSWHDTFTHLRYQLDKGRGVVLMRGIETDRYAPDQLRHLYWLLATCVGSAMIQNAVGELLGEVTDRGYNYQANNVRGYTTSAALGFHCDPADVVALLCVQPAREGGTSHIVSTAAVHNELLQHNPQFLPFLYHGFHFDLRGEGAKGDHNEVTEHRVPVFHFHHGQLSMRFNYRTIVDGMHKAGMPLSGDELAAVDAVAQICRQPEMIVDMDFKAGDIQWLSNYDCLHARSAFSDWPEQSRRRRLMRVWLNLAEGRPLRDEFSNRFNNGPKQGPKVIPGASYSASDSNNRNNHRKRKNVNL